MKFKTDKIRFQLERVHPDLRKVLEEFDRWSIKREFPDVTLTEIERSPDEMIAIYVPFWQALVSRLNAGEPLKPNELKIANDMRGKNLDAEARKRFSWHLCRCAADIRTNHYSAEQLASVRAYLGIYVSPIWENLMHDIHGEHQHLGRRDFSWRTKFDPRTQGGPVNAA